MIVRDIGPLDAKIMIVAEAPGETESREGIPLVGACGKLLKQMLSHSGINYSTCYVTNVVDQRPKNNDFGLYYFDRARKEPTEALKEYHKVLREKITTIKPNIVIALGAEAMRGIVNKFGISTWRGCILTYKGIKIISTYHPGHVIRKYSYHPIVEMDLAKANRESKFSELRVPSTDITLNPSLQQILNWINNVLYNPAEFDAVSYDIETIGKLVRCISLAVGKPNNIKAISIPFIRFDAPASMPKDNKIIHLGISSSGLTSFWSVEDEVTIVQKLSELLESKKIKKIGHNSISFDAPIIEDNFGIEIQNQFMDTMHAWHLLYAELPNGLKFITLIITDYQNYWTEKETSTDLSEWHYNAMDSIVTLSIYYKLVTELIDNNMEEIYREVNELALVMSIISARGIKVDTVVRDKLIIVQEGKLEKLRKELSDAAGSEFNPNSPKQVKALLHDKLKLPKIRIKGKITTNEVALRTLLKKYPTEKILLAIVYYRKIVKLISTYLKVPLDDDGKMRTSYNVSGTKSRRLSSSQTLFGTGMNLQNIPVGKSKYVENIRHIFIPSSPDKLFIKGDLSQAETMVVSEILYRIGDDTLHKLYQDPSFDIHNWMATFIFGIGISEVSKYQREIGKLANHSGNYGSGPRVLQDKALKEEIEGVDYNMAKRIITVRHRAIPGLRDWWIAVEKKLRETRSLTTCFGKRRLFFGRLDNQTFRDAYSYEPQCVVADVTNRIVVKIERDSKCIDVLLQVHDEVDGEINKGRVLEAAEDLTNAANIEIPINSKPLIIPIDIEVGKNWRDTVSVEEYLRMKE